MNFFTKLLPIQFAIQTHALQPQERGSCWSFCSTSHDRDQILAQPQEHESLGSHDFRSGGRPLSLVMRDDEVNAERNYVSFDDCERANTNSNSDGRVLFLSFFL